MKFKIRDKVMVHGTSSNLDGRVLTIKGVSFFIHMDCPTYSFEEIEWEIPESMLTLVDVVVEMSEIADYKYNSETGETYIKWADLTETRVKPEPDTEPNQYVGFVTAYAKKAAGNTSRINSLFDKWAIKKPIRDEKSEEKRIAEEAETQRILEKRKAKREKWLIRREAIRIKREYEARKLANEKYGVPMDSNYEK